MDKFKFIKGLYTEEVVVNKPNTELAVDINGNVITAGQTNDKVFQDQILNGVNDNSAPLKIYTVTGEMLKPVATLSTDRKSLNLNRLICRESSREGNTLPAEVKTSFEKLSNYTHPTLKFSGTRTWNIDGNTQTLCELQLNNGVSYNKNAVLKASGQLTKHTFDCVDDGPAIGTFHPGVTLNTSTFSSGAFLNGMHYDNAGTYQQKSLIKSASWSDIKLGKVWKCQGAKDSVLYSVSTANEISANGATLDLDLTTKIKNRENFTIRKFDYTDKETKSIVLSGRATDGYTFVNVNGLSISEATEILKETYKDCSVVSVEGKGNVVYNGGYPPLYGQYSLTGQRTNGSSITLSKTYNITPPVYKYSESITFVIESELVYTKEDKSIISAPNGSKILEDGQLTPNVEGKTGTVYDSDVQIISGGVYKGSTQDNATYYSMSDSVVDMSDGNYEFSDDDGHVINEDRVIYTNNGVIAFSVDFVD